MVELNVRGPVPAVFTPFNEDFTVNFDVIPQYVKHLSTLNVKGILVNGTTGEGMSMNVRERKSLAEVWLREARKYNLHVMVHVGGAPLPDVIELTKHAESIKADSILSLPELFNKPKTVKEAVSYLTLISEAAPNTPLLYYHNPGYTDVNLYMPELVTLAKKSIKTFRGLKFTSTNLQEANYVLEACGDECVVFLGADPVLVAALALGYDSSIGTSYNMLSSLAWDITTYVKSKIDLNEAKKSQRKLNDAIRGIIEHGNWVTTMKSAMILLTGVNVGPPRPPLQKLTQEQITKMRSDLKKQGFDVKA